ncbi:MAG: hypothetical protein QM788_17635 [Roseateles sp.]|uniref:hypothetical protein n=1 Tax=Roseateles sp. TaxID=1971397 RepID=UPI0039E89D42
MRRPGRFLLLCLLLVLLPLRGLLAAGLPGCEPPAAAQHGAHADHAAHAAPDSAPAKAHGDADGHHAAGKPCKLCAPCCLATAPPPVLAVGAMGVAPATRVALAPAEAWRGIVPPLPDPPPRA